MILHYIILYFVYTQFTMYTKVCENVVLAGFLSTGLRLVHGTHGTPSLKGLVTISGDEDRHVLVSN